MHLIFNMWSLIVFCCAMHEGWCSCSHFVCCFFIFDFDQTIKSKKSWGEENDHKRSVFNKTKSFFSEKNKRKEREEIEFEKSRIIKKKSEKAFVDDQLDYSC